MPVRPESIVRFERIYWAVILLGLLETALQWNGLLNSASIRPLVEKVGAAPVYVTAIVLVLLQVALWYFIARRGSAIAKWVLVAVTAYTLYEGVTGLLSGGFTFAPIPILDAILIALEIAALVQLFRPDTHAWFGDDTVAA